MTTHWTDLSAFFAMGGYGPYVWGSFGMAAAAMAAECLALRSRRQALASPSAPAPAPAGDYTAAVHEA